MKKQEIDDVFDEHKEIYLFFADLRPNSITTLQVTWTRNVSQVTTIGRYQATNLVDLLSFLSNIIDSSKNCHNFTNKLDTKHILSY